MSLAKRNSPPGAQDAGDVRNAALLDEAPLPVPPFRPWIRIDEIDARERTGRQPGEHIDRVAVMQPDVGELARRDRGQRLGHAVDERLDADEAGARMLLGLRDQVLAAAEADLEADVVDRLRETGHARSAGAARSRSSASLGSSVSISSACCGRSP